MDAAVASYPDAPAALRAKALLGSGRLALLQCDYEPAVRRLEAALRLYRELDDARGIASGLQVLGSVSREQGRYARSIELHAESLAVAEAAGDPWGVASAHGYLAFASWLQRDFGRAEEEADTALTMFRDLGDVEGTAWSLISLGTVARYQGDAERAVTLLAESLSLSEGIGFREGIAWSVEQLGLLAAVDGDPGAISLLRRSLQLHTELRDRWRMSSVLEDLAAIALAKENPAGAARLLGAAEAIRNMIGTVIAPCERLQHNQTTRPSGPRSATCGSTPPCSRERPPPSMSWPPTCRRRRHQSPPRPPRRNRRPPKPPNPRHRPRQPRCRYQPPRAPGPCRRSARAQVDRAGPGLGSTQAAYR